MLTFLAACAGPGGLAGEPHAVARSTLHSMAQEEAAARVPDGARGGPALRPGTSPLPPFTGVNRASAFYVGSATCLPCHPGAGDAWSRSAHAHARATLREAFHGYDPECLPCHQTGLGHPGGATAADPDPLDNVGCEACHGPGSDHLTAPGSAYGGLPASPAACVACHTIDTSPDFGFPAYWAQIAHAR